MTDVAATVEAYGAAWNEPDEAARRRGLEAAWSEDGIYQDPNADVAGREALIQHIGGFHQRFPGCRFVFAEGIDQHHGQFHFAWRLRAPDGTTLLTGHDFGILDTDGRIRRITGFFDARPQT